MDFLPSMVAGSAGNILGAGAGLLTNFLTSGGGDEYKRALAVIQQVQDPNFDFSQIAPQDLQLVAKYDPKVYQAVIPDAVKTAQDSPEMRQALAQGMQQYGQIAREGLPLQERIAAEGAQESVRQANRQALESSLRDLRARGMASSGNELALRAAAGQQASDLARQQGNDLVTQSLNNRLAGLSGMSNLASQTRGQDIGLSQSIANDYNNFNKWVSGLQTEAAQYGAGARERAQNQNQQLAQGVANYNAQNRQQTQTENLARKNALIGNLANFRLNRAQAAAGGYNRLGNYYDTEKAGLVNAAAGLGQGVGSLAAGAALMG